MKQKIFELIRTVLTIVGSFLVGKNIFGQAIDNDVWQTVIGSLMFLTSVVWGMIDKTATIEMFQSAIRKIVMFVGGLAVSSGKIKDDTLNALLGAVPILAPILYAYLSKKKSQEIATGQLGVSDLRGVDKVMDKKDVAPVVNTPPK